MIGSLIHSLKTQLTLLEGKIQQEKSVCHYVSLEIPLEHSRSLLPVDINNSFFLSKPDSGITMLGLGSLLSLEAQGNKRFNLIKSEFSDILNKWYGINNTDSNFPIAFLAFAFDENDPMDGKWDHFPNTLLSIPIVLIKQSHSTQTLLVNIKLNQTCYDSTFKTIEELLQQFFKHSEKQIETSNHPVKQAPLSDTNTRQPSSLRKSSLKKSSQRKSFLKKSSTKKIWQALAENAIAQIQSGNFDKLVTSRECSLQISPQISVTQLLRKLIKHYPSCTIFSYQISDTTLGNNCNNKSAKTIVAASPERLVSLQHLNIQSDALGGTIFRSAQQKNKSSEDCSQKHSIQIPFFLKQKSNQTEAESSESEKLLKEHHFISQTIYQSLDPLCHTLKMPVSPYLIKLHNLYHLETPIQGKLMANYDLFDAIDVLHPTPAVAGLPTQQAKQWLLDNENHHRGWYTGAFGWLDGNNNGDLSVMLRCALITTEVTTEGSQVNNKQNKSQLDLFAGAGLIAQSTPDAEWQETELKMQTILEML